MDQHLKHDMRKRSTKMKVQEKKIREKAKSQEKIMLGRLGKEKMANSVNSCRESKKNVLLELVIACTWWRERSNCSD